MKTLALDGVEVAYSWLTRRSYKAKPCSLMLPVRPDNRDEALAVYRAAGFASDYGGLSVTGIRDLSFLSEFPDMLYLDLPGDEPVDPKYLEGLSNLRGLNVRMPKSGIDLSCFPQLEVFFGKWHNDHRNLSHLQELRMMHLGAFRPQSGDLSALADITRLDRLTLGRPTIRSLDGIETLEDLHICEILYAPKLESLQALSKGLPGLRELSLDTCKRVESYAPIADIERLRRLKLSSCNAMADLRWTRGMNYLDSFAFVETNVEDGNLEPLLDLPRLRYVGSMNKRHYSHTCEDLMAQLDEKWRS